MVGECSQPGVGICGAMLYYPDDTIQHAGIITGLGGYAGHSHKYHKRGGSGYMFRLATVQDFSAVDGRLPAGARTAVYDEVHGLDEEFTVAYNDVDFCLRVRDPATASFGRPMPNFTIMRARAAARTRTTRPKRLVLTPSTTACMPYTRQGQHPARPLLRPVTVSGL